jgi:hypothetical protein
LDYGERMEKDIPRKWSQKQAGVLILISDKADFRPKLVRTDKEGKVILIKRVIHQEEIAIVNSYTPNFVAPNNTKQTLLAFKTQIDPNTILMEYFNTLLSH